MLGAYSVQVLQGDLIQVLVGQPALGQRFGVGAWLAHVAPGLAGVQRRRAELITRNNDHQVAENVRKLAASIKA